MMIKRLILLFVLILLTPCVSADPIISEFLASNDSELADEDGDFPDWIEIHNPDAVAVDMVGWHLTDNSANLNKWTFPNVSIPAGGYLVVFASNKDRAVAGSELHTDFKLSSAGEYLALVKPDGVTKTSEFDPYPKQSEDISYGFNNSTVLVDQNATLRYSLVAPVSTWTQHSFDDSVWRGARSSDVGVVITECGTGGTDFVELQNVSGGVVDTTGWYMAFGEGNADINRAEEFLAFLPGSMAAGGLHTFLENDGDLGNIAWFTGGQGWAMLFNASDEVMDFVVWGYTEAQIRSLNINRTISMKSVQVSYSNIPWSGAGAVSGNVFMVRSGSRDSDTGADWSTSGTVTFGSQNPAISRPFTSYGQTQAQAGIGYEEGSGYENVLLTNIDSETSQVWVRFPFHVDDPSALSALTLRLRYDDGFQAFINGVAVANANDVGTISQESAGFVDFNLNAHLSDLRVGQNVLAIRLVNESSTSSDLLLMPELVASLPSGFESFVYLTNPTPGVANQGGVLNAGPILSEVTENPTPPADGENLLVTARVQARTDTSVQSVVLRYRVDFGGETVLTMKDDGTSGDVTSGDGIYSATIPASASGPGDMLRWTVVAEDSAMKESRMPLQADVSGKSQSPEYYGTVVVDPGITTALPVFHRFVTNTAAMNTEAGTRGSFFYDGRFYDNVFIRIRGNTSTAYAKKSHKIDFNDGFLFHVADNRPLVEEINLNTTFTDKSFNRAVLAASMHQISGLATPDIFHVYQRLNGNFFNVAIYAEQIDETFIDRNGIPEGGALYKADFKTGTGDLEDTLGLTKKTRKSESSADLQALTTALKLNPADREKWLLDIVDVASVVNWWAGHVISQNIDATNKNYYIYRDTEGTGEWQVFPWDLDLTFGPRSLNSDNMYYSQSDISIPSCPSSPFVGARPFELHVDKHNYLLEALASSARMRKMLTRRIRTLNDQFLATGWFASQIDMYVPLLQSAVDEDHAAWGFNSHFNWSGGGVYTLAQANNRIKNEYLTPRVNYLTVTHGGAETLSWVTGNGSAGIPPSQSATPSIVFGSIDHNPVSGNQDEEYIELQNTGSTAIDLSGWTLSGGVELTFKGGVVLPAGGSLYLSPDRTVFRQRASGPTGGNGLQIVGNYSGHLGNFGETLVLKNADDGIVVQTTTPSAATPAQQNLVISQFHYDPVANVGAEFIEIMNISTTLTIDLTGVHFTRGVDFTFTGSSITSLGPGEKVLVVRDQAAFELVYGTSVSSRIAGVFASSSVLDNSGETIKLEDSTNSTIHSFTYSPAAPWPVTDGRSLVLINPTSLPEHDLPENWTLSAAVDGSPAGAQSLFEAWLASRGQTDPLADPDFDGWNELLTYSFGRDLAGTAFIHRGGLEVFNVGGTDGNYVVLETTVRQGVSPTPQTSLNLSFWADATLGSDVILVSDIDNGDGTRTHKYRLSDPVNPGDPPVFLRLKVVN